MAANVTVKSTTICFNGREYPSVEEMPPDVRRGYERAMKILSAVAPARLAPVLESASGVVRGLARSKVVVNGEEYADVDAMPPAVRGAYEAAVARLDANRNGIPDAVEGACEAAGEVPAAAIRSEAVEAESTGWRVGVAALAMALGLLGVWILGR